MSQHARQERAALCDLFIALGPDAPTLCEGWANRDLAAHLVLRERRPDAAVGIVVRRLAGHAAAVQRQLAQQPWDRLVEQVRTPPAWSPMTWRVVDEFANLAEFFVHHEDVRRAQPGWQPRNLDPDLTESLWRVLRRNAKLLYRRAPTGVVLRRPDGVRWLAHDGSPAVIVSGDTAELVMHAYGRTDHARVRIDGDPDAIAAFRRARIGL